jgi:hypothetical protein
MKILVLEKSSLSQFGLLEYFQKLVELTNPLLETYAPPRTTKAMHICNCPRQHGNDKMHQVLMPQV